jgi:hypothetical protein
MAVDGRQIFLVAIKVDSILFRRIGYANFNESVSFFTFEEGWNVEGSRGRGEEICFNATMLSRDENENGQS